MGQRLLICKMLRQAKDYTAKIGLASKEDR